MNTPSTAISMLQTRQTRQIPRICRKKHKPRFKTAPQYAYTNPPETATPSILAAFTAFLESLWNPSSATAQSKAQKSGMAYLYDEDGTLMADTLSGAATTSWGQSAKYIHLPTASGPMPVAAIYGSKHYAIQSDHLNTPRRLLQSDGQVAWQWAYSAFGEEKPTIAKNRFANTDLNQSFGTTNVAAVTFNLRYPGQYYDQESNLHYNYHRSYSPKDGGRYTQADPIGLDGGWNRFGYAEQNPLSYIDPTGEAGIAGVIGGVIITGYGISSLLTKQAACEKACDLGYGDAVKACGDPDRQDELDIDKSRRVLACKASCAFGSIMGRLLPGKLK